MSTQFETFDDYLAEQLQDPDFCAEWEAQEPTCQIARLRILRGLTQEQLAERVGTKQPSIARLESGKGEPKLSFLRRVAEALSARIEVRVVPTKHDTAREPAGHFLNPTHRVPGTIDTKSTKKRMTRIEHASTESGWKRTL
jgi:transcriptional regulator with XRE-family HTH domain